MSNSEVSIAEVYQQDQLQRFCDLQPSSADVLWIFSTVVVGAEYISQSDNF